MRSTIETTGDDRVRLSIEIDESEFDRNLDRAFRKIASQVRVPGFRQGKAPRRVLEAQIGTDAARSEAIQDAVQEYLTLAVREHQVDLIATPEITITGGEAEGPVSFDAACQVRPEIELDGYVGLVVEMPSLGVTDAEVDEAVDSERARHGTLREVSRPIERGDHVALDLTGSRDGEPLPGLNVEDWMYEVGKGWVTPSFDERITGLSVGERAEYSEAPNGTNDPADVTVLVKKISVLDLPKATDEWVSEHLAEFDSLEAWRASIRDGLVEVKLSQARSVFVERATVALAALVTHEIPEAMANADLESRMRNVIQRFAQQGISIEQWLQITGQTAEGFVDALRDESNKSVRIDLALRAVARKEALEVSDDEVDVEIERIAVGAKVKPAQVRRAYEENDAMDDLRAQMRKSRALDWVLERCEYRDPDGNSIEAAVLTGAADESSDPDA